MVVGYYSELDPFSGGISPHASNLPRLVRDLSVFLLMRDIVIVPPGSLLEHGLTLPAFEALAPFVRAGRLTTTTSPSCLRPIDLVDERLGLHLEGLSRQSRHALDQRRRAEIASVATRWGELLPTQWSLTRDVDVQVGRFSTKLIDALSRLEDSTPAAEKLRHGIEDMAGASRQVNRHRVLAKIVALRGVASPREIARLFDVVQSLFFQMGVAMHKDCALFPGAFTRQRPGRRQETTVRPLDGPVVDNAVSPKRFVEQLDRVGIDANVLLSLPPHRLLELAESESWRRLREVIRMPSLESELASSVAALFEERELTNVIDDIGIVLGPVEPSVQLPAPWQLSVRATLGATTLDQDEAREVTLDLSSLRICEGHRTTQLTRTSVYLLVALIIVGDAGIAIRDLKQLTADVDRLEGAVSQPGLLEWVSQKNEPKTQDRARTNRLNVAKNRLAPRLEAFGFEIVVADGRWQLVDVTGRTRRLGLTGTLWELLDGAGPDVDEPEGLSAQQSQVWQMLLEAAPHSVTVDYLARGLGKDIDELGLKQVTDIVARLRGRLDRSDGPVRVVRVERGRYRIAHLAESTSGPTREVW